MRLPVRELRIGYTLDGGTIMAYLAITTEGHEYAYSGRPARGRTEVQNRRRIALRAIRRQWERDGQPGMVTPPRLTGYGAWCMLLDADSDRIEAHEWP